MITPRPLRVYLSSMYRRRGEMVALAELLRGKGHVVTSRWITVEDDCSDSLEAPKLAVDDVADVLAADVFVFFSELPGTLGSARGERHVEFGIALGARKAIVVVGSVEENIFHRHPRVSRVETAKELIVALKALEPRNMNRGAA